MLRVLEDRTDVRAAIDHRYHGREVLQFARRRAQRKHGDSERRRADDAADAAADEEATQVLPRYGYRQDDGQTGHGRGPGEDAVEHRFSWLCRLHVTGCLSGQAGSGAGDVPIRAAVTSRR